MMNSSSLPTVAWRLIAVLAGLAVCGMVTAAGLSYPQRPVRMLVGYPPGGPSDLTARLAVQHLSERLGQQFIVDNRGGAGGTLAVTLLTQANPDGHTVLMSAGGEIVIAPNLRKLPYDPTRDIIPVSRVGSSQLVLLVHPSVPAKSVAELVALTKAKPGSINYASSGTGSTAHLAGEQFRFLAGINIVHVPYKGAGPALSDLMAGQVQMLISAYSSAYPHIRAGKLRALGLTGSKRLGSAPELPVIAETLPGYLVQSWYGLHAPKGTPPAIIAILHRELAAMTRKSEIAKRLITLGIEPEGNTPQEFLAQIRSEMAAWGKVIKAAGIGPQ